MIEEGLQYQRLIVSSVPIGFKYHGKNGRRRLITERDNILEELKYISRHLRTSMVSSCKGRLDTLIEGIESGNYTPQSPLPERKTYAKSDEPRVEPESTVTPPSSSETTVDPFSDWED